jgi:single-strand DNA-binding protein
MAQYLNKVQLIGRLGRDPESMTTSSGKTLTKLNIATTDYWNDSASNERRERTEWHSVITWEKTAQFVKNYLSKGNLVYVEGSLRSREYTDQNGNKRKIFEINANTVLLLQGDRKESRDYSSKDSRDDGFKDDMSPEDDIQEDDDVIPF